MGIYLCPRCLTRLDQVPDIGKDCDCKRRCLRDYAKDVARVEDSRKIIFDKGMSVGGELEILKFGSLIPTRVTCFPPASLHFCLRVPEFLLYRAWCQPGKAHAG